MKKTEGGMIGGPPWWRVTAAMVRTLSEDDTRWQKRM